MHISRENYIRQALDEAQRTKSKKSSSTVALQAATEWDILHADWLNSLPVHPRMAEWVRRDWLSPDERALRVDEAGRWLDYRPERDGQSAEFLARVAADLAERDRATEAALLEEAAQWAADEQARADAQATPEPSGRSFEQAIQRIEALEARCQELETMINSIIGEQK